MSAVIADQHSSHHTAAQANSGHCLGEGCDAAVERPHCRQCDEQSGPIALHHIEGRHVRGLNGQRQAGGELHVDGHTQCVDLAVGVQPRQPAQSVQPTRARRRVAGRAAVASAHHSHHLTRPRPALPVRAGRQLERQRGGVERVGRARSDAGHVSHRVYTHAVSCPRHGGHTEHDVAVGDEIALAACQTQHQGRDGRLGRSKLAQ